MNILNEYKTVLTVKTTLFSIKNIPVYPLAWVFFVAGSIFILHREPIHAIEAWTVLFFILSIGDLIIRLVCKAIKVLGKNKK
jgi:hypothetical protein